MKETERNDQRRKDTSVDPKTKDTGLQGDDADMSRNSTAAVDDGDTETVDPEISKDFDDTDQERDYRSQVNEVKNDETDQDVETDKSDNRKIDQNNTNNKGK